MLEIIRDRISYELADGVARIELCGPGIGNRLDLQMGQAVHQAAERAVRDAAAGTAQVVAVSARGSAFSVGGDLREFARAEDRGTYVRATADELHAGLALLRADR